jgi:hypothetical protein
MKIFMSYRRQDSEWVSLSLFNELKQQFPNDAIFKDFNVIRAGDDFNKAIESNLQSCNVLLVVIAENWLTCKDENGNQRLFLPDDYVCLEISTAIKKEKKVIPVLINNTQMPSAETLPESIKELHKLQAVRINNSNFEMDVFNLANEINDATGRRNQYADLVKDIATGKVNQQELVKPETNTAYAVVCICLGLLILFLNIDTVPFVVICLAMIACGVYAYFLSRKVKPYWLNKDFDEARKSARSTKLISLIAAVSGLLLLLVVFLLQFIAGGGMKQANDLMQKMKTDSSGSGQKQQIQDRQNEQGFTKQDESISIPQDNTTVPNEDNNVEYQVTENTYIYNSPSENDVTENFLIAGSLVRIIERKLSFAKVQTVSLADGNLHTFWIDANAVRQVSFRLGKCSVKEARLGRCFSFTGQTN